MGTVRGADAILNRAAHAARVEEGKAVGPLMADGFVLFGFLAVAPPAYACKTSKKPMVHTPSHCMGVDVRFGS
jgi:hypothetical protein